MSVVIMTRDDFVKMLFDAEFFNANSAFAPVEEQVAQCKAAYLESAAKSTCRCGGSAHLVFDCIDATLALMETMRTENPAGLAALIDYLRQKRNDPKIKAITLYYRKTSTIPLLKVKFP